MSRKLLVLIKKLADEDLSKPCSCCRAFVPDRKTKQLQQFSRSRIKCILWSVLTQINIRECIVILGSCCRHPARLMGDKDWLDQRNCSIVAPAPNSLLAPVIKLNVRCDLCCCGFTSPLLHPPLTEKEMWSNVSCLHHTCTYRKDGYLDSRVAATHVTWSGRLYSSYTAGWRPARTSAPFPCQ